MSQIDENVVALRHIAVNQWIEAFNRHDVAAIVALYADDAELFDAAMKRPRRGRKEIERWFSTRFRTMPSIVFTPRSYMLAKEQTAVTWTVHGRGPRILGQAWLSRLFQVDGVSVFTIHDGLIQKQRGYYDHLSALEQLLPFLKWILPARL